MPKQLYKITQFHGGLNSNSDARDIADNELSDATDVMVDELGKIRLMGGTTNHTAVTPEDDQASGWDGTLSPGYGLFSFSHDVSSGERVGVFYGQHRTGANAAALNDSSAAFIVDALIGGTIYNHTDGSSGLITDNDATTVTATLAGGSQNDWDVGENYYIVPPDSGDNYIAQFDDNDQQLWIYSSGRDTWDDDVGVNDSGVVDIGTTSGAEPTIYIADGALRISDGNFGGGNQTMWYGYISRSFFGSGSASGILGHNTDQYGAGKPFSQWWADEAAPKALSIKAIHGEVQAGTGGSGITVPTAADPITVSLESDEGYKLSSSPAALTSAMEIVSIQTILTKIAGTIATYGSVHTGFNSFVSGGDVIFIKHGDDSDHDGMYVVESATSTVITVVGSLGGADDANDSIVIWNLSRATWFDDTWAFNTSNGWEVAVSTLYDDSKQESPLHIMDDTLLTEDDFIYSPTANRVSSMTRMKFVVNFFAGDGTSDGIPLTHPRVSGFNLYMRKTGTGTWWQQANIDVSRGIKLPTETSYTKWEGDHGSSVADIAEVVSEYVYAPQEVITYEDSAGRDSSTLKSPFEGAGTGFKTAVIANRRAYVGNIKANDNGSAVRIYPDAILKSQVNQFDSFSIDRRLESDINDGDAIIKLEEYADRLLQFKKKKMTLINISQEVEFIEDNFIGKGVNHPAAVCKTDFGVAWVNEEGCYLYDGQKVSNLLEKGGRQIIKESLWSTFVVQPMIGYIPKKRQLIVADDITTNGDGAAYLYDMVTQSWVKGADDTFLDQNKTNFVIDYNNDLIYAHTNGTIVKWDDAGDDSTAFVLQTKDIDFGQPAQKKKIYKVYVTYTGVSSLSVNVDYQINGDNGWTGFASGEPLTASSAQNEATLTLSSPVECYSFQLKFSGTGKTTFEINDISIVFRLKGQR